MGSLFNDISFIHYQDKVCIPDGRQTMGDNKAGPSLHQVIHSTLYPFLGPGIYRGCCLIQDQDLIVCQNCPGNSQKLFLSLGNIISLFI